MPTRPITILALACSLLATATPAAAADPIAGRWVTAEGDAIIGIGDCGGMACGRIVKFLETPPQGADQRDVNNPDRAMRKRRLLGLPVLTGFAEESDLWRGTIYDPKTGRSYRSVLRRKGADRLEVKGCIGPFCRTQTWRRAR